LRTIEIGEEVTVSYLTKGDLALGVLERRARLRLKPGMEHVTCSCPRCCMEADESDGLAPPTPKPADALLSKFQEGARSQAPAQDGLHGPEVQAGACASDLSSAVIKSSGEMDELD
jgi:hypothetical protein